MMHFASMRSSGNNFFSAGAARKPANRRASSVAKRIWGISRPLERFDSDGSNHQARSASRTGLRRLQADHRFSIPATPRSSVATTLTELFSG